MTDYRISEYPNASIGLHYSVDFKVKDGWFIRSLHQKKEEAQAVLNQLTKLKSTV